MTLRQRIAAKARSLPPQRQRATAQRQHVYHTGFDYERWKRWIRPDTLVDRWVDSLFEGNEDREGYYNAPQLLQDVSYVLYKANPVYVDQAQVKPDAWLNRSILDLVTGSGAFDMLRSATRMDADATAQGTASIADVIAQILEAANSAVEAANALREADDDGAQPDQDQAEALQAQVDEVTQQFANKMSRAMRNIARHLNNQQDTSKEFGHEPAELGRTDPADRQRYRDFLNRDRVQQLANQVGRMKRLITGRHSLATDEQGYDPVGIEQGDDLPQVLEDEWLMATDEVGEWEFLRRYDERRLLQHQTRQVVDSGMGDVALAVDCSGSMGSGNRLTWALAVAESVRQLATAQGRHVRVALFNADVQWVAEFTSATGFDQVMDLLSADTSGGTNLQAPLDDALGWITTTATETADVLLITDGEYRFSDDWVQEFNQRRHDLGVRTHIVHIDTASDRDDTVEQLNKVGDHVTALDSLTSNSGSQVMTQVLNL